MREPPLDLSNDTLRTAVIVHYGLAVAELTFLPLGHDSSAWVYRVRTSDDTSYFVKLLQRVVTEPSLLVPHLLHDLGVEQVIVPLPTVSETLRAEVDGYTLILYPFVEGMSGKDQGMSPSQWIAYGSMLQQIHAARLPADLVEIMPRETFVPAGADLLRALDAHVGERPFAEPVAQRVASFWRQKRTAIHTLVKRAEELGGMLTRQVPPFVLCHADIHTANVLVGSDERLWIVDWDETTLAPRERDLMFVAGGGINDEMVGPGDEALFFEGYGETKLDPLALTYYRCAWAVSDISAYGADVFLRSDLGQITKQAAVEEFMSLFMPGRIVAKALASPDL